MVPRAVLPSWKLCPFQLARRLAILTRPPRCLCSALLCSQPHSHCHSALLVTAHQLSRPQLLGISSWAASPPWLAVSFLSVPWHGHVGVGVLVGRRRSTCLSSYSAMRTAATPLLVVAAAAVFLSALLLASASRLPPRRLLPLVGGGGGEVAVAREEKVRLGSSPPSCYSKCYGCSPCVAVQVPTLSAPSVPAAAARGRGDDAAPLVATFTNYKPLGWKCQCRDRLFDP